MGFFVFTCINRGAVILCRCMKHPPTTSTAYAIKHDAMLVLAGFLNALSMFAHRVGYKLGNASNAVAFREFTTRDKTIR